MSGNEWWSAKVGADVLSDLVIFSILSFDIPLDFYRYILVVAWKYLMYFITGINIK